jgi:hypothetical protein
MNLKRKRRNKIIVSADEALHEKLMEDETQMWPKLTSLQQPATRIVHPMTSSIAPITMVWFHWKKKLQKGADPPLLMIWIRGGIFVVELDLCCLCERLVRGCKAVKDPKTGVCIRLNVVHAGNDGFSF